MFHFGKIALTEISNTDRSDLSQRITWRRPLWGDNRRRYGAPHDVSIGVARETTLVPSTIFVFEIQNTNIHGAWFKC